MVGDIKNVFLKYLVFDDLADYVCAFLAQLGHQVGFSLEHQLNTFLTAVLAGQMKRGALLFVFGHHEFKTFLCITSIQEKLQNPWIVLQGRKMQGRLELVRHGPWIGSLRH